MSGPRVALIIPAFNEAETIEGVVSAASVHGHAIVVDDGSSDETGRLAAQAGATVVSLGTNQGYDRALDEGMARAAALGSDVVVTLDADGQHDPSVVPRFLRHIDSGADLVVGVRSSRPRFAEHVFAWYSRMRFGVQDPLCGLKAYRIGVYEARGHFDSYGSIGTELVLFAASRGFEIREEPLQILERNGEPRFGRVLAANFKIARALVFSLWRV